MSRLVACGCSFTFGHGLPDCRYDGVKYNDPKQVEFPSEMAWPQVAARIMGIECVNLSRCGESNRYIAQKLVEFEYQPGDIVVPMWTHFSRRSLIREEDGTILPLINWQAQDVTDIASIERQQDRASTAYYNFLYNEVDAAFDNLVYINFVDFFVKSKGLQIIHTCNRRGSEYREAITSPIVYETPWNRIVADLTFDDYVDLGVEEDGHPNVISHESFASRLVEHIKNT